MKNKTLKKFVVFALAIAMVFGAVMPLLATSAGAAGANKTTVTNASTTTVTVKSGNAGDSLDAIKVVTTTINDANELVHEFTPAFEAFKAANATYADLSVDDYMGDTYKDTDNLNALLGAFASYARTASVVATATAVTDVDGNAEFTLGLGQYIIVGQGNTTGAKVYQTVTAEVVPEVNDDNTWFIYDSYEVDMKVTEPTVAKSITAGAVTDGDTKSASYGDDVTYNVTIGVPTYPAGATNTTFYVTDVLPDGMDFVGAPSMMSNTGVILNNTHATVNKDGRNLRVDFNYEAIKGFSTITLVYNAELNEDGVLGEAGNINTANLVWSNTPTKGTTAATTDDVKGTNGYGSQEVTVALYTYGIEVTKVDSADDTKKLVNAEFEIYTDADFTNRVGNYVLKTDANGVASVDGLKAGTYYLKETKAPTGYKTVSTAIEVVVDKDHDNAAGYVEKTVANTKGGILPTTGGMGTVIFTVVGASLMVGAAVLLITKARMKKD